MRSAQLLRCNCVLLPLFLEYAWRFDGNVRQQRTTAFHGGLTAYVVLCSRAPMWREARDRFRVSARWFSRLSEALSSTSSRQ